MAVLKRSRLALVALVLAWTAMPQAPAQTTADEIHYSYTGRSSVAFDWRGGTDEIRYGLTAAYGTTAHAHHPSPAPFSSAGPFWETALQSLSSGATYHYSIAGGPDATFSAPPLGVFTFDVVGDIGSSLESSRIATTDQQIATDMPALVLAVGDLTYAHPEGQRNVDQHFNDAMAWSRTAAYMPAWGNHEWDGADDDLRNYKGRFSLANAQTSPGAPSAGCCGEDWGWFDAGGVRFISYPEPYTSATWRAWATAAGQVMAAAQSDPSIAFIVTFGHRPAYSTGYHPGDSTLASIMNALGDKYSKYVLNLNGHSHDYERFTPIHGVTHITSGGGGIALETPWRTTDGRTVYRAMRLHHLRVLVTPALIRIEAVCGPTSAGVDLSCAPGVVFDSVVIPAAKPV